MIICLPARVLSYRCCFGSAVYAMHRSHLAIGSSLLHSIGWRDFVDCACGIRKKTRRGSHSGRLLKAHCLSFGFPIERHPRACHKIRPVWIIPQSRGPGWLRACPRACCRPNSKPACCSTEIKGVWQSVLVALRFCVIHRTETRSSFGICT